MDGGRISQALYLLQGYLVSGDQSLTGFSESDWQKLVTVRQWQDLVLFNYTNYAQYHAEWTDLLRVCRGVVFTRSGGLVSLPFVKFFNLGEHVETDPGAVARWSLRSVTDKVDGVMIQVFRHDGQLVWASRHGVYTGAARLAEQIASDAVRSIVSQITCERWTLIMELVHKDAWQLGMVYPGDDVALYLLYVRDLDTFELTPASAIWQEVSEPLRLPKQYLVRSLDEAVAISRSASTADWEGLVLQGAEHGGNLMVKLKSPLYVQRLALLKGLSARRLLSAYESGGWDAIDSLLSGIEEVIQQTPLGDLMTTIRQVECQVNEMAGAYLDVPREQIQSVPVQWRWVVGYRDNPEKFQRAVRKSVVSIIERQEEGL